MTAERLVSMRFEKITILFFGLFLGFLFYPLLITPFPKVPLTRELKILGIEDAKDDVDAFCPPGVPVQCSGCKSLWASPPQSSSTKASHTLLCSHFPRWSFFTLSLLCYISTFRIISYSQPTTRRRPYMLAQLGESKIRVCCWVDFKMRTSCQWFNRIFPHVCLDTEEMSLAGVFCK